LNDWLLLGDLLQDDVCLGDFCKSMRVQKHLVLQLHKLANLIDLLLDGCIVSWLHALDRFKCLDCRYRRKVLSSHFRPVDSRY
jgi:hypothetical protein